MHVSAPGGESADPLLPLYKDSLQGFWRHQAGGEAREEGSLHDKVHNLRGNSGEHWILIPLRRFGSTAIEPSLSTK